MGVVEGDAALVEVQAHPQPGGQGGGGEWVARRGGVGHPLVGQQDLAHAHGQETERGRAVLGVLCPTVVPAVWIIPVSKKEIV